MEQWFDPKTADIISGALGGGLGVAGGVMACSYGLGIRKGWKKLFYTVFAFIIAVYVGASGFSANVLGFSESYSIPPAELDVFS